MTGTDSRICWVSVLVKTDTSAVCWYFSCAHFRYIKFLTKKYLNKQHLKDWVRVQAPTHGTEHYFLTYYNICNDDDDDAMEESN